MFPLACEGAGADFGSAPPGENQHLKETPGVSLPLARTRPASCAGSPVASP